MKQVPSLSAGQLRHLVRDMCRRARLLPTAVERIAMLLEVAIFYVEFHTMKRGSELSAAVALRVLQMTGGEVFIINFLFGKTLRSSSRAVVVKKMLDGCKVCTVAA